MWVLKAEYQTFTYFCILAAIIPNYPKANTLVCKNGDKVMERNNRKFKSTLKNVPSNERGAFTALMEITIWKKTEETF